MRQPSTQPGGDCTPPPPVARFGVYLSLTEALAAADGRALLATGESVIKCPSPLNVLKDTYDVTIIAFIEHVQMNIST
jgi:hypothetical protein